MNNLISFAEYSLKENKSTIHKFDHFNSVEPVNEFLKTESTKIRKFLKKLSEKIKDNKIITDINNIVSGMIVDPYSNFDEIMRYLSFKFKENPEVCELVAQESY